VLKAQSKTRKRVVSIETGRSAGRVPSALLAAWLSQHHSVDLNEMLSELKGERDKIDQVIMAITPLAQGKKKRLSTPLLNALGTKKRRECLPDGKPTYPDAQTA
jgi:hypothetical protein